jgi:hypothetical protein
MGVTGAVRQEGGRAAVAVKGVADPWGNVVAFIADRRVVAVVPRGAVGMVAARPRRVDTALVSGVRGAKNQQQRRPYNGHCGWRKPAVRRVQVRQVRASKAGFEAGAALCARPPLSARGGRAARRGRRGHGDQLRGPRCFQCQHKDPAENRRRRRSISPDDTLRTATYLEYPHTLSPAAAAQRVRSPTWLPHVVRAPRRPRHPHPQPRRPGTAAARAPAEVAAARAASRRHFRCSWA